MSITQPSHDHDETWNSTWRDGFGYIFWGLILVFINISVNGFDLLPNGLGYALIALGASRFANESPHFTTTSALSWVLLLVWCGSFFAKGNIAWGYVTTCFNVAMFWFLLSGIVDISTARHRPDLAERAFNCRLIYTAVTIGGMFLFLAGTQAHLLIVAAVVAALIVGVLIVQLVYRVRYELA